MSTNCSKVVYFHLQWAAGQEYLPVADKDLLVVAIAESLAGPYYRFESSDMKVDRHRYFRDSFLRQKQKQKVFQSFRNVRQVLSGVVLDEYFDHNRQRFKFNKRLLSEYKHIDCSCKYLILRTRYEFQSFLFKLLKLLLIIFAKQR